MKICLLIIINIFISIASYVECKCPQIISKNDWGGETATRRKALQTNPPPYVVVHHSDTPSCTTLVSCMSRVKNIQSYHMNVRGWNDIGYNFLIGGDGNVYEGRGWGTHGAHVVKYNSKSIGICLIGNFQEHSPPKIQLDALEDLIQCGVDTGKLRSDFHIIGHRQGQSTDCPGNYLYNEIKALPRWEANPN